MKVKAAFPIIVLPIAALSVRSGLNTFSGAYDARGGGVSLDSAELAAVFGRAASDDSGFLDQTEFERAEQLVAGRKASHGEGGNHGGGSGGYSHWKSLAARPSSRPMSSIFSNPATTTSAAICSPRNMGRSFAFWNARTGRCRADPVAAMRAWGTDMRALHRAGATPKRAAVC